LAFLGPAIPGHTEPLFFAMLITVLGAAAGGGFPQWNCACRNCRGVREGTINARPCTQSSIFVQARANGPGVLLNASPDILTQIKQQQVLWPAPTDGGLRHSPIAAVMLCDGQVDHVTGLVMLRERGGPLPLWCTDPVAEDLSAGYPLLNVLSHFCGTDRHAVAVDGTAFTVDPVPGLRWHALALDSKAAPYSPHREAPVPGDNIGLTITDEASGRSVFYAPGLGAIAPAVFEAMQAADVVMVDGTFWTDDEMPRLGVAPKTARSIGHLPQSGEGGMIEWLDKLSPATRRVLIHINNTNPIHDLDSAERAELAGHRIEVAYDGLQLSL
jgi:pyrroloquinoline quinone biosynthesis protein B